LNIVTGTSTTRPVGAGAAIGGAGIGGLPTVLLTVAVVVEDGADAAITAGEDVVLIAAGIGGALTCAPPGARAT
jgi:hypothetical protein